MHKSKLQPNRKERAGRTMRQAGFIVVFSAGLTLLGVGVEAQNVDKTALNTEVKTINDSIKVDAVADASIFPFLKKPQVNSNKKEGETNTRLSRATVEATIKAPRDFVWDSLTDFLSYPKLFPRMSSCKIIKRTGDQVYLETELKPQMFVRETCQHTVNEIGAKPELIRWRMLDGTFKSAYGEWKLIPVNDGKHCLVKYSLEIDPGPAIPRPVASWALKMVQKEIIAGVKQTLDQEYERRSKQAAR
ncbi:MAG: SRPBCC family protein [Candidatus Obscuribacter phosphatis]|uniref:SRPBCC family protein n=1 Tax=Candidatus Obscuribacter phosphatis TaxID=1906157 RepID=A0A8J7P8T4_9BACT|nr:SRPBCC family protein [Candidatus Obscuribacter phosphatis]